MKLKSPELTEGEVRSKLVGYGSIHSNSAIEKSGLLAAVKMRLLESDEDSILHGDTLQQAIEEDIKAGLIPFVCIATGRNKFVKFFRRFSCNYWQLERLELVRLITWRRLDRYARSLTCGCTSTQLMLGLPFACLNTHT